MEETTLKKLQYLKADNKLIVNAPNNLIKTLEPDTYDIEPQKDEYDFILVFGEQETELRELAQKAKSFTKFDGLFWLAYPKGTGNIKSDLKREVVWKILQDNELKAVSQIAINSTWSALRGRPMSLYT